MQNARGSAAVRSDSPAVEQQLEAPKKRKKSRQRRQNLDEMTLEVADRIKRQKRRKSWRELGEQSDRRWPRAPLSVRRARAAELVLATAAIARGTVEAFELLGQARDGAGHRLMRPAALKVLRSYMGDAQHPVGDWLAAGAPGPGWLFVPAEKTQRERADAIDLSEKSIRNGNDDLIAAGLLAKGRYVDWGDGMRMVKPSEGEEYLLELKRLEVWLAPAVAEMLGAPRFTKAGNGFPAAFPEGDAGASPNVEGPPLGGPEVDEGHTIVEGAVSAGAVAVAPSVSGARAESALSGAQREACSTSGDAPGDLERGGGGAGAAGNASAPQPHRKVQGALGTDGKCGEHGSTGRGDLQAQKAAEAAWLRFPVARPRRRRR